jgi:Ca2+/Na+ antiporter
MINQILSSLFVYIILIFTSIACSFLHIINRDKPIKKSIFIVYFNLIVLFLLIIYCFSTNSKWSLFQIISFFIALIINIFGIFMFLFKQLQRMENEHNINPLNDAWDAAGNYFDEKLNNVICPIFLKYFNFVKKYRNRKQKL